jgi:DNA-binding NarL/FixJ family response regulator
MAGAGELPPAGIVIRVLLADDQAMIRQGLRMILDAEPGLTIVGEVADGAAAVALVPAAKPDVVLMDVRMPKMDGIAACQRICTAADPPRVLMLTTFDLEDYVYAALRAGASGFLLKDAPADQLVEAIEVVARGDAQLAPQITRLLIEEVAKRPSVNPGAHTWVGTLTEREGEVLRLMSRGRSNAEIGADIYLGEATVKTYVGRVLAKLGARDRVQAVVMAYESGFVEPGLP